MHQHCSICNVHIYTGNEVSEWDPRHVMNDF